MTKENRPIEKEYCGSSAVVGVLIDVAMAMKSVWKMSYKDRRYAAEKLRKMAESMEFEGIASPDCIHYLSREWITVEERQKLLERRILTIARLQTPSCEPNWEPLHKHLPPELCGVFMFMASYPTIAGLTIHTYKHRDTRRYLNIDDDGACYRYTGDGCYEAISTDDALTHAFE